MGKTTSWTQQKIAQAYVAVFKTWSNENCTEACSVLLPFGILELMEWRSLNKVLQSSSQWLMPWNAPAQQFSTSVLQWVLPGVSWGSKATPSLLVFSKQDREYLIANEETKKGDCSDCRGGREEHALNEIWIILQHGPDPSLCGVCSLRLLLQSSLLLQQSWWDPVAVAVHQPCAEEGSNPPGLKAPNSHLFLMMPTEHMEKLHATQL